MKRFKVDNAIIIAAGTSSRFVPLSYEKHKGLITVKGEVLIERQIKQLLEAGITDIYMVVGYKKEQFEYLQDKFGVKLIANDAYLMRNNHSSIWVAREFLKNSYVCSVDNYFSSNPFEKHVDESYYATVYATDYTNEWCVETDEDDFITDVKVGGSDSWYMLGHTFWSEDFSNKFIEILEKEYENEETKGLLWESIYQNHLDVLKMKIRRYEPNFIFEFDTLDELRAFDESYIENTRSKLLKDIAEKLSVSEGCIKGIKEIKDKDNAATGFTCFVHNKKYSYNYQTMKLEEV